MQADLVQRADKIMTRADKCIFVFLITFSILSILFMNLFLNPEGKKYVIIETNGKEYAKYNLDEEKNINTIEIKTNFGYNKIEICSDYVKMVDANCKDKQCTCEEISSVGGMIVCLPNKCVVRIEAERGVDGVSY